MPNCIKCGRWVSERDFKNLGRLCLECASAKKWMISSDYATRKTIRESHRWFPIIIGIACIVLGTVMTISQLGARKFPSIGIFLLLIAGIVFTIMGVKILQKYYNIEFG